MPRQNDRDWEKRFGSFLKLVFDVCLFTPHEFASRCSASDDTVRSWLRGQRLPDAERLASLVEEISGRFRTIAQEDEWEVLERARIDFACFSDRRAFNWLYYSESDFPRFTATALKLYYRLAKGLPLPSMLAEEPYKPTGKVRAVVFDFAGTLVRDIPEDSTWYLIWKELGLPLDQLREISRLYGPDSASRTEFFDQVTAFLTQSALTRQMVQAMGRKLKCIDGTKRVFEELSMRNIRICIVSRSERDVIKAALGDLVKYVDEIQSNAFEYDETGRVVGLVETDFDYEGKARYVMRLAADIHSSTEDIVFVGNSDNDAHVRCVGASTYCINPANTNASNQGSWTDKFTLIDNLAVLLPKLIRQDATESV